MKRAYITAQEAVDLIKENYDAGEKVTGFSISVEGEKSFSQEKFGNHRQAKAGTDFVHIDEVQDFDKDAALGGKSF